MKSILTIVFFVCTWMETTDCRDRRLSLAIEWRGGVMYLLSNSLSFGDIPVSTYHVSCDSDTFDGSSNYIGIVLYQKDGLNSFVINGHNIRAGYIYFVKSSKLSGAGGKTWHSAAYEHKFGVLPPSGGLVSSGFSHHDGVFKRILAPSTFNGQHTQAYLTEKCMWMSLKWSRMQLSDGAAMVNRTLHQSCFAELQEHHRMPVLSKKLMTAKWIKIKLYLEM